MRLKVCENCGYRHGRGNCCINIYQQLGKTKGPSVVGMVLLAFRLPILLFIGNLILAEYVLFSFIADEGIRLFFSFLEALAVTAVFVQLIKIFTGKPVNTGNKLNRDS